MVRFQEKNLHFLLKNLDLLIKNLHFYIKTGGHAPVPTPAPVVPQTAHGPVQPQLAHGWVQKFTADGAPYYENLVAKTAQWERPVAHVVNQTPGVAVRRPGSYLGSLDIERHTVKSMEELRRVDQPPPRAKESRGPDNLAQALVVPGLARMKGAVVSSLH